MSNALTQQELDTLEALIDRTSLTAVVEALGDICHEKAEHVLTTWQDRPRSQSWRAAGFKLAKAADFPVITLAGQ